MACLHSPLKPGAAVVLFFRGLRSGRPLALLNFIPFRSPGSLDAGPPCLPSAYEFSD